MADYNELWDRIQSGEPIPMLLKGTHGESSPVLKHQLEDWCNTKSKFIAMCNKFDVREAWGDTNVVNSQEDKMIPGLFADYPLQVPESCITPILKFSELTDANILNMLRVLVDSCKYNTHVVEKTDSYFRVSVEGIDITIFNSGEMEIDTEYAINSVLKVSDFARYLHNLDLEGWC